MLKKMLSGFILLLSLQAVAVPYEPGVHYTEIPAVSESITPPRELREYFSLLCPHCHDLERYMPTIKKSLPAGVQFERTHVDFLGGIPQPLQTSLTQAMAFAQLNGKQEEFVLAAFDSIHEKGNRPNQTSDVLPILQSIGFSKDQIDAGLYSMPVNMIRAGMQTDQELMVQSKSIKGVPALVLHGRYLIHLHELDRKDPIADLTKLIEYLDRLPSSSGGAHGQN